MIVVSHLSHLMAWKKAMVSETRHDRDRISSLPDDVLCHILSFLPTKYSVRTRILSTRWKYLFSFVPTLDFEYSSGCRNQFLNFVDWVLDSHNSHHLIKFRFDFREWPPKKSDFTSWISYVVDRGIREIDISVNFRPRHGLPCCFFSCKTLEILKLFGNCAYCIPKSACLPCLKTLVIQVTHLDASIQRLFSSCPVLEDLLLSYCNGYGIKVIDISIPTLKRLTIDAFRCNKLLLNLPILEHFRFVNSMVDGISGETFQSLDKAFIRTNSFCCSETVLFVLLKMVCNARHIYLSTTGLEEFPVRNFHLSLPIFNNLTHLELGCIRLGLGLLPALLENSNNLEVLVFTEGFFKPEDNEDATNSSVLPEVAPHCVCLQLKEIKFRQFKMLDNECELVQYFLKHSKLLDKMIIETNLWIETRNKLLTFSRYSTTCQVVIKKM